MEDQEKPGTVVEIGTSKARKRTARRPAGAARRPRKPAATRRAKAPTRRRGASSGVSFETVIRSITGGVAVARAAIAEASGEGATAVRRVAGNATDASRRTVARLADEWRGMEPRRKARLLAALLGAVAAASVPLVRKSLKK
ncbi:MAG TPA: hypothetical protein VMN82_12680 [Thermoanaerobaculia bacterium]|nr:hypothetical protein [Thermoanaerobaculia bacterium]